MSAQVWTDAELADLERDYDRDHGGHDDVVALVRGARAVVAMHRPVQATGCCVACCSATGTSPHVAFPCPTVLALALEETS